MAPEAHPQNSLGIIRALSWNDFNTLGTRDVVPSYHRDQQRRGGKGQVLALPRDVFLTPCAAMQPMINMRRAARPDQTKPNRRRRDAAAP